MEITIDHVMFPVYFNNSFLNSVEENWTQRNLGYVDTQAQNDFFKGLYLHTKSFYVEYLSTVANEPYWSNAVYVVVPNEYWDNYETPDFRSDHFLIPKSYDGLTILISKALEYELCNIGGEKWTLPSNGKLRVHEGLHHLHDIAVIDENDTIVAPLFEANPVLRDFF